MTVCILSTISYVQVMLMSSDEQRKGQWSDGYFGWRKKTLIGQRYVDALHLMFIKLIHKL